MITFLEGQIAEKTPARVVLNVNGVGYEVFVPLGSYERLPAEGGVCRLLVYEYIREDQHALFGFTCDRERQTFAMLMNVSGIGPKIAMSALSSLAVADLVKAIAESDIVRLTAIAGVGRKLAERMALELRDKIVSPNAVPVGPVSKQVGDAVMALVSLGYKQAEAERMVAAVATTAAAKDMPVEEIVRRALRR